MAVVKFLCRFFLYRQEVNVLPAVVHRDIGLLVPKLYLELRRRTRLVDREQRENTPIVSGFFLDLDHSNDRAAEVAFADSEEQAGKDELLGLAAVRGHHQLVVRVNHVADYHPVLPVVRQRYFAAFCLEGVPSDRAHIRGTQRHLDSDPLNFLH